MGWLTTEVQLTAMLDGVEGRGWPQPDLWWRDESRLWEYWQREGYEPLPKRGCFAVPCGGEFVVWIARYTAELWSVAGFSKFAGITWYAWGAEPAESVTLWNARDYGAAPKRGPLVPGQAAALIYMEGAKRRCRLGRVITVLRSGAAATVLLGPELAPVSAVGERWFQVREREEAFEWFFSRGRTEFRNYMAMVGLLYHKQRKLTGEAARGAKQSKVPYAPERQVKPAAPIDHETEVTRLKAVYDAAENDYNTTFAAKHAIEDDTSREYLALAKAQTAIEERMAAAWDAWDAACQAWLAEIIG